MPVRFTSPSLGAQSGTALNAGEWQLGFVYRNLHANRFYVGHAFRPDLAPGGGMPVRINVNTVELNLSYAPTSRVSLNLGIPVATGRESRAQGDHQMHTLSAAGLGDMSLVLTSWLLSPEDHAHSNLSLGVGVKAPTGQADKLGPFVTAAGTTQQRTIDPSAQLGDGGWGMIFQTGAFRQIGHHASLYAAGTYLASPRAHNAGTWVFGPAYGGLTVPIAVPDEYSAHGGLTYAAWAAKGLTLSLGGRIDGVPLRDLIGGGDDSFRRPGYVVYVEPGLSLTRSRSAVSPAWSSWTLSVPIAVDQNRESNLIETAHGQRGGGDFARFLVFLGYSRRFFASR